ncbi:MAG: hypothetical protein KJ607_12415 [Bacteroidetes bacterium]|nr:hypothetical protein [Bacteroidota bacterium]
MKRWLYNDKSKQYLSSESELILPSVAGEQSEFEAIFFVGGKLVLFTTIPDEKTKCRRIYVQYLNHDGTLKNKPIKIGEAQESYTGKKLYSIRNAPEKQNFEIIIAPYYTIYQGELFRVKLIDYSLSEVFSKNLKLPLENRNCDVLQCRIDSKKNTFFAIKAKQLSKRSSRFGKTADEFLIVAHNNALNTYKKYPIKIKKDIPYDIFFDFDRFGNIVIVGLYTQKNSRDGGFSGVFSMKINPATQNFFKLPPKLFYKKFDREFQNDFSLKRYGDTPEQRYSISINDLAYINDDEFVFVAEQFYKTTKTIVDPMTKGESHVNYYYYNDLLYIVVRDGMINRIERVPKSQYSIDDGGYYSSYSLLHSNYKNIKILFNDHPANMKERELAKIKELKNNVMKNPKGMPVMITIYEDGSFDKQPLFNEKENDGVIVKDMIVPYDDGFIIYVQEKDRYRFGTFRFY